MGQIGTWTEVCLLPWRGCLEIGSGQTMSMSNVKLLQGSVRASRALRPGVGQCAHRAGHCTHGWGWSSGTVDLAG